MCRLPTAANTERPPACTLSIAAARSGIAVVEQALHRGALGSGVEAVAPALVAFELGEVAAHALAMCSEQRPRLAGIELVQAAGDELDRRLRESACAAPRSAPRASRARWSPCRSRARRARGRDRSHTTDRALRGAPPSSPAMRSGTRARRRRGQRSRRTRRPCAAPVARPERWQPLIRAGVAALIRRSRTSASRSRARARARRSPRTPPSCAGRRH